jgi:TetR/AcrR family transcriptional regulator, regulator of autoinduction and epiphytic fitness
MPTPPTTSRRGRKRSQTQDHLAKAAERLFRKHGFDAVTMELIATAADVARGTLYNHFPTKEAVLAHWIHMQLASDLQHLAGAIGPHTTFADGITPILAASAEWCERHRTYLPPYLRHRFLDMDGSASTPQNDDPRDMISVYQWLIQNSQDAGAIRTDISAEHLALMFHHLYFSALLRWLGTPGLKLKKEFDAVVLVFIDGAASPKTSTTQRGKKT